MNQKDKNIQVILQTLPFKKNIREVPHTKYFDKLISEIKKLKISNLYDIKISTGDNTMIIISDEDSKLVFQGSYILHSDKDAITLYNAKKINKVNKIKKIKLLLANITLKYFQEESEITYVFSNILI
jgi:hypothetical protein